MSIDTEMLSEIPRWVVYTVISSVLCILGVLTVPLISVLTVSHKKSSVQRIEQKAQETINSKLLNYGLSISAGSMLMTSLYKMLPKTNSDNKYIVTFGCLFGVVISLFLNFVVHAYTSESLIHCAHGEHEESHGVEETIANERSSALSDDLENQPSHQHHHHPHNHTEKRKKSTNKQSLLDKLINKFVIGGCQPESCDINSSAVNLEQPVVAPSSGRHTQAQNTTATENETQGSNEVQQASEDTAFFPSDQGKSQEIKSSPMCLENSIGYDLKHLDKYRNNYYQQDPESAPLIRSSSHHSQSHGHSYNTINTTVSGSNNTDFTTPFKSSDDHIKHEDDHHHHMETPFSKLISIGLQTCVVLTLHKLPEGLILYFTNQSKKTHRNGGVAGDDDDDENSEFASKLGFSIFVALAIHNFIEGFAMCLPLYTALSSKISALLLISLLAGGSQPLGAFLGWALHKRFGNMEFFDGKQAIADDLLLSITSGFLFVISLQMLQTAIGFSDAHSHEEESMLDEDDSTSRLDPPISTHTSGTTCLKWCCFGALLILFSGLFV